MCTVCTDRIRVFFSYLPISTTYSLVYIVLNVWTKRQELHRKLCKIENEILFSLTQSLGYVDSIRLLRSYEKNRLSVEHKIWLAFSSLSSLGFSEFSFSLTSTPALASSFEYSFVPHRCLRERAEFVFSHTIAELLLANINSFQGLSYDDWVTLIFFLRLSVGCKIPIESVNKQTKTTISASSRIAHSNNRNFSQHA